MEKITKTWVGVCVLTVVSAVIFGMCEAQFSSSAGFAVISIGYTSTILLLFLGIAVHEAGHLSVGLALGLRCRSALIGPLHWIRERNKWRFSMTNDARLGGFVTFDPYRSESLKKKYIAMYAGGPIASLLFALLMTVVVNSIHYSGVVFWPLVKIIALMFVWLMVANFIPMRVKGFGTDGYWIWATLTGNKSAQAFATINRVVANARDGKPDESWDEEDVRVLREVQSPLNLVILARVLLFWHAWAQKDTTQAREYIIESLQSFHKLKANVLGLRHMVFSTAAFSAAMIDRDAEIVKEFLGEIDYTPPTGQYILTQIESWLAKQEGREQEAVSFADKSVRQVVAEYPDKVTLVWSHVENYRKVGDAEYAAAIIVAEELIGPRQEPQSFSSNQ